MSKLISSEKIDEEIWEQITFDDYMNSTGGVSDECN